MEFEFLKRKRVTKPKRGYYSEVIGTTTKPFELREEFRAPKRRNFTAALQTERHAPFLPHLVEPSKKTSLAPARRWIILDESQIAFPMETFRPKVQRELTTQPRQLPRNVLIERRRREYCEQKISKLMEEAGITKEQLIPTVLMDCVMPIEDKFRIQDTIPFLPLELFDNEDYEIRSPHEWINLGLIDDVRHPLPADAFLPVFPEVLEGVMAKKLNTPLVDLYGWMNVAVIDYNSFDSRYKVRTLDGTDTEYEIPRLYFKFKAEDPKNYIERIKDAIKRRAKVEESIKYQTFLDCMMFPGLQVMSDESARKILELSTRNGRIEASDRIKDLLANELKLNYERTLCDIVFRKALANSPELIEFVKVPDVEERPVPATGRVSTSMKDFKRVQNYVHWDHLFVIPETYLAVHYVVGECMNVSNLNFYNLSYGKYVPLDEFDSLQTNYTQNVIKFLKSKWVDDIVLHVRMCLRDVGKGWFDLEERNHGIYDISKLKRLMELFKHRMQGAIRQLVENSMKTFLTLLETPCVCCLDVEDDFVWGDDFINSPFVPVEQPVFLLQLAMNENEAFYNVDVSRFKEVLLRLYDTAIRASHTIPQVHPFLLKNLKFARDLALSSVGLLESRITSMRTRLDRAYTKALIPLVAYAKEYYRFCSLWKTDISHYVNNFASKDPPSEAYRTEISEQLRIRKSLEVTIPSKVIIGPFYINVDPLRTFLITKQKDLILRLLETFASRQRVLVDEKLEEFKAIQKQLLEKPSSIENLLDIKDDLESVPFKVNQVEDALRDIINDYDICEEFLYALTNDDFEAKWEAVGSPYKLLSQIDDVNSFLDEETERFMKIQADDEAQLTSKIEQLTTQVQALTGIKDTSKMHETANDIRRLWKNLKEAQEFGQLLNQRQKLFGQKVKPFDSLNKLIEEFEPYRNLWVTASDWLRNHEIWVDNPLETIDAEAMQNSVNEFHKTFVKCAKLFSEIPAVLAIANEMKEQIEDFQQYVPIIVNLRNPGMKERHWYQFHNETGLTIEWGPTLSFKNCLDMGIMDHAKVIAKIADTAEKEYGIEKSLKDMQTEWDQIDLEILPYKDTDTFMMKISDETLQLIDDHIQTTQQLSFSPYKAIFEKEIADWDSKLHLAQTVLDEWMELQKSWLYLEPIFTSGDINRQLPGESKKYAAMERIWKNTMKEAKETPNIMKMCPNELLLQSLKEARNILDQVEKGLADYLETKRSFFPRFYFLSDEELLEILAQSKDPRAVQPHLRKCFENIAKLKFEEDLKITAMYSAEGECVELTPSLYPEGNVENWLSKVEENMCNTIMLLLGNALADLANICRKDWVLKWPGQIVIAGSQTDWTAQVEKGIRRKTLPSYYEKMLKNLDELRDLVKGTLKPVEREIICALIVIEVHARDVTNKLVESKVRNANDFDWISQLRYYWKTNPGQTVKVVNAEFPYGYEYLGNSGRLVITPLTDRCYLTLTGALHLKFGGAPAGPAGTGKTETTKDLAKAMAIQCVVFNCSDQLDVIYMGKFFKGLASSGAWACFDEFNRIDIEVLSVIAQQITAIQKAQAACVEWFTFEGDDIKLKASCAVFITMNPGYAGRTELPDNLKALFRPVAMMVPNYALIAEISLFSFGFSDARELAGKITTTFKLSSEQLSTQDHYDFGMRAVKTVIAVAGNLKREKPKMDEKQIILRAIRDVNVPKFLKDDLKLFHGIVSDLFPRMEEEIIDYGNLEEAIIKSIKDKNLQDVPMFVSKVIQLYETTVVRHGLMLVGPTGSGKTKCYEVLKNALTSLNGEISPSGSPFVPIQTFVVNPKSITMGQLYGQFDMLTHEWTDGILASLVRHGTIVEDSDKRWYIFDGPVDAVWIENMNSVLDDNKKLCLSSGEIIQLTKNQSMIFEVADLAVASPATVSRCGMVYLEPSVLGLQPFIECWAERQPKIIRDKHLHVLRQLIDAYLLPALEFVRASVTELVASMDSALVFSFLQLLDVRIVPLTQPGGKPLPPAPFLDLLPELLEPWVIFALVWSVGATGDNASRGRFSEWLRRRIAAQGSHKPLIPPAETVYDYDLLDGGFALATRESTPTAVEWKHWMHDVEAYAIGEDMRYADIEVPTVDNVRNAAVLAMLAFNEHQVLCVGPTGTGKTVTISSKLGRGMPKKFVSDFITFSARTSANQTQDLLDAKLEKRRKGVFGPPMMKKQVFFIDDLNMPALEVYGAQPPIELIRQWMDFGGWYDRKNIGEFKEVVDVTFVGAMCPPGGGRNPITMRLLRHFHYLAFVELEDNSKRQIFGTILRSWLSRAAEAVHGLKDALVTATMAVYATILQELLPTPAKTHYTFNLRDLSKVFQGVLMVKPARVTEERDVLLLWHHECCRVFQDRLVNDEDRSWFEALLRRKLVEDFQAQPEEILGSGIILFADFIESADSSIYAPIHDITIATKKVESLLEEYNESSTAPMALVLFVDAVRHLCRIKRIVRQPLGNALLLGVSGSGRSSLTRLASFIADYRTFAIELTKTYTTAEWREDLKGLMMKAGINSQGTVFLFSDTQVKDERFLEDLNNILNSGDVPNIYANDELELIYAAMKGAVQQMGMDATRANLFTAYQKSVRSNLHVCLTMSPIGETFRARLRQFPALVNCCTIDWFSAWPEAALKSVALRFLTKVPDLGSEETLEGLVVTVQNMHQSVVDASQRYFEELSRTNYVTPTSYLELLRSYAALVTSKRNALSTYMIRLRTGLETLLSTVEVVKKLQVELGEMTPKLAAATEESTKMLKKIAEDQAIATQTKEVVEKEEKEATKKAEETQAIADDAQRDLDAAMPMLMAAENSLKALNKNDISEVRAFKRPPPGVLLVMETICIVKDIKPVKVQGAMPGEKVFDYWEPTRSMLSNSEAFMQSLLHFDRESITEAKQLQLKPYIEDPNFQPAKILAVSKACTSLCMWVHAIYKYYFVNKAVAPKKAALAQAKAELEVTVAALNKAKERMQKVLEGLELLEAELRATEAKKADLEATMQRCKERMDRAVRLVNGLADERERWIVTVDDIKHSISNIIGDILVSAGAIAYLTPFTDQYRRGLLHEWVELMAARNVPHTPGCTPVDTMGDPVSIRQWQLFGLPRDYLSTENAVLVFGSQRYPLFVDPQGQANRWIRNMGKESGMLIGKLTDKDLQRTLETAVRFGKMCLLENIGKELDPILDPILLRQVYRQKGTNMIKIGDSAVPISENFRLFMTTKLPNPSYPPEICIKVLLVNFALIPSGLEDQLLALVVMSERPDLEEQRGTLVVQNAQMKNELKEIEEKILQLLAISATKGDPIDDLDLIATLESSKAKSEDIKVKVAAAETTQAEIDETRALYIPVAKRAQIIFFCLVDLASVDPMYQYSLEWFTVIFAASMENTERTRDIKQRVATINDHFTFSLFCNVCRSLFERHKLQFAFLLCTRIQMAEDKIDMDEWRHFLAGASPSETRPNPAHDWLSEKAWLEIQSLELLPLFEHFVQDFSTSIHDYKKLFDSPKPHEQALTAKWESKLDDFQRLLVLKSLRPDKVVNALQNYIHKYMGQKFIEPQTSEVSEIYEDSNCTVPLIFILSTGTDPAQELYKFANKMNFTSKLFVISLGQGQGPRAEAMMNESSQQGFWVFFQNCHLAPSWMPRLEFLVENIDVSKTHTDFRIWLTSAPSPDFPVAVLQRGSKMTIEPPRGIKANMIRSYAGEMTELKDYFESKDEKVPKFKSLLFSLCLFHGVCLERRKFGPLGFNIAYEFTSGDLRICISQLKMFITEYDEVPFKVLSYTAGEINYGGRVTDDWDRRCIMSVLADYYNKDVTAPNYAFYGNEVYHQLPPESTLEQYMNYLKTLPLNDDPEFFGLHANADISCAQQETIKCLSTLLALQPRVVGSAAQSQEEVTADRANEILSLTPHPLDLEIISNKYPVSYSQSLNTVLVQEVIRYNPLLTLIHSSLEDLLKALKGLVVLSEALENVSASLFTNVVPNMWTSKAYPSLKPLGAWVKDLKDRIDFLSTWVESGIPVSFWISGFFFPQAFLTGNLQNFARKYVISIDSLAFAYQVMDEQPGRQPEDGCYVFGLFLEGALWDINRKALGESRPKELFTEFPVIWMRPEQNHDLPNYVYESPVYKTLTRAGTLSTTGHSTNYVVTMEIPSSEPQSHWIKRGVALICALDY